jgi:hypothetical protein
MLARSSSGLDGETCFNGWLAGLSTKTASVYMRWARTYSDQNETPRLDLPSSLFEMRGGTERRREARQSKQQQEFKRVLREVARSHGEMRRPSSQMPPSMHDQIKTRAPRAKCRMRWARLNENERGALELPQV